MTDIDSAADTVGVQLVGHLVRLEGPMTASDGCIVTQLVTQPACRAEAASGRRAVNCTFAVGGTRFEIVTSSVSGRPAACLGESLNAPESSSPGQMLPQDARGCLQNCGEWLPLWLPLWRFGSPVAAQSMLGFRRCVMIRRSSRPPRLDRAEDPRALRHASNGRS